ncbi:hypothetical protein K491DRAFT_136886 [Lophiostoma macrostomum CBS 122681]|uniref:Uncharacterized protein n=1 Tax=Lophiostoma macrostomum CBS 122681 TaxID=1314788 RepID=A0A6A6TLK3_9PLEO|nr:hypothetical protein K491DRAFT_136886 [Lophiostoma macrostomum CBS 122681]
MRPICYQSGKKRERCPRVKFRIRVCNSSSPTTQPPKHPIRSSHPTVRPVHPNKPIQVPMQCPQFQP